MVALDPETVGKVFRALPEDAMERISREIAALGVIGREEMLEVLTEFRDSAMLEQILREGGYDSAIELIRKSLPEEKAARLVRLLEAQRRSVPFRFLEHAESDVIATILREEHPQTIALVLSHLHPAKAAEVLARLPSERQVDIVRRIATLGPTSGEVIERVEAALREHLASPASAERREVGGIQALSEIRGGEGELVV
jgi:flagellar motor switch protein FliG